MFILEVICGTGVPDVHDSRAISYRTPLSWLGRYRHDLETYITIQPTTIPLMSTGYAPITISARHHGPGARQHTYRPTYLSPSKFTHLPGSFCKILGGPEPLSPRSPSTSRMAQPVIYAREPLRPLPGMGPPCDAVLSPATMSARPVEPDCSVSSSCGHSRRQDILAERSENASTCT